MFQIRLKVKRVDTPSVFGPCSTGIGGRFDISGLLSQPRVPVFCLCLSLRYTSRRFFSPKPPVVAELGRPQELVSVHGVREGIRQRSLLATGSRVGEHVKASTAETRGSGGKAVLVCDRRYSHASIATPQKQSSPTVEGKLSVSGLGCSSYRISATRSPPRQDGNIVLQHPPISNPRSPVQAHVQDHHCHGADRGGGGSRRSSQRHPRRWTATLAFPRHHSPRYRMISRCWFGRS